VQPAIDAAKAAKTALQASARKAMKVISQINRRARRRQDTLAGKLADFNTAMTESNAKAEALTAAIATLDQSCPAVQ